MSSFDWSEASFEVVEAIIYCILGCELTRSFYRCELLWRRIRSALLADEFVKMYDSSFSIVFLFFIPKSIVVILRGRAVARGVEWLRE